MIEYKGNIISSLNFIIQYSYICKYMAEFIFLSKFKTINDSF
jgi:hypothetical protein